MRKRLYFLKKLKSKILKNTIFGFLFKDPLILKMIISFIISLLLFWLSDKNDILLLWFAGLLFLGYSLITYLIELVYAWIINPMRMWSEDKEER